MHPAFAPRGRARNDVRNAGRLRGGDAHDCGGDVGVAPSGDVAARGLHRDQALSRDEPRGELGLELGQALALRLGEAPHPFPREADVVAGLRGELAFRARNRLGGHDDVPAPPVELLRVAPRRALAAGFDVREHLLHASPGLRLPARRRALRPLHPVNGHRPSLLGRRARDPATTLPPAPATRRTSASAARVQSRGRT